MMATERGGGPGSSPGSSRPAAADYSVLVVVGALQPAELLGHLMRQIDSGEFRKSFPVPRTRKNRTAAPWSIGREHRGTLHNKTREETTGCGLVATRCGPSLCFQNLSVGFGSVC